MISARAAAVGAYAFQELTRSQVGQVSGVTSAGVFIRAEESGRILFLTEGRRRGPVSVNLGGHFAALKQIQPGELVQLGGMCLVLPGAGVTIQAEAGRVWRPAERRGSVDFPGAWERLTALAQAVLAARPGKGLSGLLATRVSGSMPANTADDPLGMYEKAKQVQDALAVKDLEKAAVCLARFLGYGPGLTPSGDDLVLGVLLLLNRWLVEDWGEERLSELNRRVIEAAKKSTTAISATLIECAADGQADEGLIGLADYILSGVGEDRACVESLLGWGSNSGIDTLAGIAMLVETGHL